MGDLCRVEPGDRGTEMKKGDTSSNSKGVHGKNLRRKHVGDRIMESKRAARPENGSLMLVIEYEMQYTDLHQCGRGKRPPTHIASVGVDISAFKSDYCVKKLSPRLVFHKTLVSI